MIVFISQKLLFQPLLPETAATFSEEARLGSNFIDGLPEEGINSGAFGDSLYPIFLPSPSGEDCPALE
jgi:hypothetical protein